MSTGRLIIDLDAVVANWRSLDAMTNCKTAAVVKANGYGLGSANVAKALFKAGVRQFFVAVAEEAAPIREELGPRPEISVFSGHMKGDTDMIRELRLTPMINSVEQLTHHLETLPDHPFGVQLDTGMNRLGMEMQEWAAVAELALSQQPTLVMSHLACADEPDHPMNAYQLDQFKKMTDGISVPRSLAATGGVLLVYMVRSTFLLTLGSPGLDAIAGAIGALVLIPSEAIARKRRNHVTSVTKSNALQYSQVFWDRINMCFAVTEMLMKIKFPIA